MHVEEVVRPFRISKVSLKADSVLELPPHTIYRTGTQVGDCSRFPPRTLRAGKKLPRTCRNPAGIIGVLG